MKKRERVGGGERVEKIMKERERGEVETPEDMKKRLGGIHRKIEKERQG